MPASVRFSDLKCLRLKAVLGWTLAGYVSDQT